jgi:hypothetical protein
VRFLPEQLRLAKGQPADVTIAVRNNAPAAERGLLHLRLPDGLSAETTEIPFGPVEAGQEITLNVSVKAVSQDAGGEILATLIPHPSSLIPHPSSLPLPVSVGVTVSAWDHPVFPAWIVRAPGYEIHVHKEFGVGRVLIDRFGNSLYGRPWWGGAGIPEVRLHTGAEDTAPICWGKKAQAVEWQGKTLRVVAASGETLTATFRENSIEYQLVGKEEEIYNVNIMSFFLHSSGVIRSCQSEGQNQGPSFPCTIADLHWSYLRQPGFSPDCIIVATPREPAGWPDRLVDRTPVWRMKSGERFILAFGAEETLSQVLSKDVP